MEPATVNKQHVPPCDQMTKEQQAVVDREQQAGFGLFVFFYLFFLCIFFLRYETSQRG